MDLGIRDRLALVTGASRGIGRAIATTLAQEGARVILVARNLEKLEEARAGLAGPERHRCFSADLMGKDVIPRLARAVTESLGRVEILVHNLGGSHGVFKAFAPAEEWQKVWQFNVGTAHDLNRAFIPAMVEAKWGRIVHLSTLSTRTCNGYAPYVSAKCALDGYVKSVNREVSKDNVILSAVAPGAFYSEGRYFAKLQEEDPGALAEYFTQHLPIRRLGRAEELGPVVAFLCSEYASFMAGTIVGVDGGGM